MPEASPTAIDVPALRRNVAWRVLPLVIGDGIHELGSNEQPCRIPLSRAGASGSGQM